MQIYEVKNHVPVYAWLNPKDEQDWKSIETAKKVALLPQVFHHVALMPDAHPGIGCTIGSVIAMKNAVSAATVGVDLYCSMSAVKYNLKAEDLPDNLDSIFGIIMKTVPIGFDGHKSPVNIVKSNTDLWNGFDQISERFHPLKAKAASQCGTLGSGNHMIELCLDTEGNLWVMIHSGSRNVGKTIAEYHINVAKKLTHNTGLPDPDLATFLSGTPEFDAYYRDMLWCKGYTSMSHKTMLFLIDMVLQNYFHPKHVMQVDSPIMCNHNYLAEEVHFDEKVYITRKGAISARKGELGIIPGSQTTKSYIVKGLGNTDSFMSASHGAGRRMSRGEAKRQYTEQDLLATANRSFTVGGRTFSKVECRTDRGVLDEIEHAYKSIDEVMANQSDLVEIVAELKQVMTIKG